MELIKNLEYIPNLSLALGFFDGVHLAHQKVISDAVNYAKIHNTNSAVITFAQHPKCFINNIKPQYILNKNDRYEFIKNIGIDYIIELDFNNICNLTPEQYLENVLCKYFTPKYISTGFNHRFGAKKVGDAELLRKYSKLKNFHYNEVDKKIQNGHTISSTAIRNYIREGNIENANNMLGKDFFVSGTIVKGKQLGAKIGFPTANIIYPDDIVKIPNGVYKVEVEIDNNSKKQGLANFGTCPTVSNTQIPVLETHILNFNSDIYNKNLKVYFKNKIRDEKKFSNIEELKNQINNDIKNNFI